MRKHSTSFFCGLIPLFWLLETWLRRRAYGLKPAADVYLGMTLTAVMPCSRRVGGFRIPPVHGKLGIPAPNHEPVGGITGHDSTDFTSEFLQRCHTLRFPDVIGDDS